MISRLPEPASAIQLDGGRVMAKNRKVERAYADLFSPPDCCVNQRPTDPHPTVLTANDQAKMHIAFEPPQSDESGDLVLDSRYDYSPVGDAEIY